MRKKINIILAGAQVIQEDRKLLGIGKNGKMPWHNSEDMSWFKEMTIGNFIIMGRKTYESIGKPLKNRINVVISSNSNNDNIAGVKWVKSLFEGINFCQTFSIDLQKEINYLKENPEIFIIGGGKVFNTAFNLNIADNIYIDIMSSQPYSNFDTFVDISSLIKSNKYKIMSRENFDNNIESPNNIISRVVFEKKEKSFDDKYLSLVNDIIENGERKQTRAGETLSVFGRTIRVDLRKGLPMLTTKKMFAKGCIYELLWFIKGDTNIKYLIDNNVHIWDDDAYRYFREISGNTNLSKEDFLNAVKSEKICSYLKGEEAYQYKFGDLGPVYGKQWTDWNGINQLDDIINKLKNNPNDRRLLLSSWNVGELKSMALPPCHYSCQFYTKEISLEERIKIYQKNHENDETKLKAFNNIVNNLKKGVGNYTVEDVLNSLGVPKYYLSCMWNQRSVDVLLGLPFNFLSYAILTHLIAKCTNMIPNELIFNGGDTHIYTNQIKEYLLMQKNRDPYKYNSPNIEIKVPNSSNGIHIEDFTYDDIKIIGYESYPAIKYPLSVGL